MTIIEMQDRIQELEAERDALMKGVEETSSAITVNMQVITDGVQKLKAMLDAARAERDEARRWVCTGACHRPMGKDGGKC